MFRPRGIDQQFLGRRRIRGRPGRPSLRLHGSVHPPTRCCGPSLRRRHGPRVAPRLRPEDLRGLCHDDGVVALPVLTGARAFVLALERPIFGDDDEIAARAGIAGASFGRGAPCGLLHDQLLPCSARSGNGPQRSLTPRTNEAVAAPSHLRRFDRRSVRKPVGEEIGAGRSVLSGDRMCVRGLPGPHAAARRTGRGAGREAQAQCCDSRIHSHRQLLRFQDWLER